MQSWKKILFLIFVTQILVSAQDDKETCSALEGTKMTRTCSTTTGCKTMNICDETGDVFFTVTCAGDTYCTEDVAGAATCELDQPADCDDEVPSPPETTPIEPLVCTAEGFFPDPYECNVFHYCSGYGLQSDFQTCPENTVFNPEFNSSSPCKAKEDDESDCSQVDCTENSVFKHFGTSEKYFAYCWEDPDSTADPKEIKVSMFMCIEGTSFDGVQCAFQCKEEGNFANPRSSTTYYQCYYANEVLVGRMLTCPGSRQFDENLKICR
nr:uncharacterized protein LOC109406552 [Aedes albopictus]